MSANPRHFYSLDEYFALEEASDACFEYWDGDITCMSGGSRWHYAISGNIFLLLGTKLKGKKCRAMGESVPVKTEKMPPYKYPDAMVVCGTPEFEKIRGTEALVNPTLVVEVMSPSSESRDRKSKFKVYGAIDSLKQYLVVAQNRPFAELHTRDENGVWSKTEYHGLEAVVPLASLECELELAEVYQDVEFPT
ncbi:MAG: Uma2 family endonuclease [Blastocatellia bacterium]|nr:Uma2 family endonuclease [Blastocatellia bacterium]